MKKIITGILILSLFAILVFAKPSTTTGMSKGGSTVTVPAHAVQLAPGLFSLGTVEYDGKIVEGIMFVDYKKRNAKPGTVCGNGVCEQGENAKKCAADCGGGGNDTSDSSCFAYIGKGAKWKSIEDYIVDPTNSHGLSAGFVSSNMALNIDKWEDAADGTMDGSVVDIFGNEVAGIVDGLETSAPDGKNEVFFGSISDPGAIAVTVVWGIFRGPPSGRELVEWDQVYDDVDYDWSDSGEAGKMDFENIATHEVGHAFGMDHPSGTCTEETMYAFASEGETIKRDLNSGDIAGIDDIY